MKHIYLFLLTALACFPSDSGFAQNNTSSGPDVTQHSSVDPINVDVTPTGLKEASDKYHQEMLKRNTEWDAKRTAYEEALQHFIAQRKALPYIQSTITIPLVFHIVYHTPTENVPDNQVLSQIVVLNQDYARLNPDTVNTPAPFALVAAHTGIQFCLAQQDPQGNLCSGIERRYTNVDTFSLNDAVKFYNQGGMDQWDPTRYFNIWVCNTGGVCYGEFPVSTTTNTYGVVMNYFYFGSNHTSYGTFPVLYPTYDRGRVNSHEIGHCLNLYHTWGDDGSACTGTDYCADTPNEAGPASGCFTFPHTDSCTSTGNGVMFENYMDYSNNDCVNIFTQDQNARMQAVLSTPPYNALPTSNACSPVITTNNSGIRAIIKPGTNSCSATFSPVVLLKNYGVDTLTSCHINYFVDANTPSVYTWSGSLPSLDTVSVTLVPLIAAAGIHTFTAYTSLPNTHPDSQVSNDTSHCSFGVLLGGAALPFVEGFEGSTFVPAGWTLSNPDASNTWARTTTVSFSGIACAKMDNLNYYNGQGKVDEMIMPPVDLTSVSNPGLSFDMAYTYYHQTNPTIRNFTDTLNVMVSADCGQTFTSLFKKGGAQLATVLPVADGPEFIPTASNWQNKIISLGPYQADNSVIIKFRNTSGWGNQLYIDNINITNNVGIAPLDLNTSVHLYPNPTNGQLFIDLKFSSEEQVEIKIYDLVGRTLSSLTKNNLVNERLTMDLSSEANGIYFVEIIAGDGNGNGKKITQKIVLDKK